jgi:hypothetical protein
MDFETYMYEYISNPTYNFDKVLVVLIDKEGHDPIARREALLTFVLH